MAGNNRRVAGNGVWILVFPRMVAIAGIGLRERLFDNLGLMGLELLESSEFFYEWNNFVEDIGKCLYMDFGIINHMI